MRIRGLGVGEREREGVLFFSSVFELTVGVDTDALVVVVARVDLRPVNGRGRGLSRGPEEEAVW